MRQFSILAGFALLLFATSCTNKFQQAMLGGTLENEAFLETISFERRMGLLVMEVELAGKTRRFVLDSGAPNLLTKELAAELGLPVAFQKNVGDSQGGKAKLDFVVLPELKIGDLVFDDMLAVVGDLNASPLLRCLEVEGLIGANLMRRARWQIDFQQQQIHIASSLDSLPDMAAQTVKVPFSTSLQGTPQVDFLLNGVPANNFIIDLGSNGAIDATAAWYRKNGAAIEGEVFTAYGAAEAGLYGYKADSTYIAVIDSLKSGQQFLGEQVIEFEGAGGYNIGNAFLDQFLVTIDWQGGQLYLLPQDRQTAADYSSFGFKPVFAGNQLTVGYLIKGSAAEEVGMEVGKRIFFLNGIDCLNLTNDQFCKMVIDGLFSESQQLDVIFEDAAGTTTKATLQQQHYFTPK
ncbi:MAG: aspartyl protease family protein [Phaeodactylibacter sp.]|nr:aspartyl protease family protein [Phaeodactylibacter sp.]